MPGAVLALNAGSSSIKFALYETDAGGNPTPLVTLAKGEIDGIDDAPHFVARGLNHEVIGERRWAKTDKADFATLLRVLLDWADAHLGTNDLIAVGHRVVHGGREFVAPVCLDAQVLEALDALTPLAPLHQRHSLAPVRAIIAIRPGLPQVACFDTAFHHTMPAVATRYALPRNYETEGIRRYGFHGLSYEYIARQLHETAPHLADGRTIVAHLGNGASLCAMKGGQSIDTTMGFTALDGLMMGSRCGALDPGVILYMLQEQRLTPDTIQDLLYRRSGLLGISGLSSDMRVLLKSDASAAGEAIELFVYRLAREAAAIAGSLGGLDGLVFTAGIGEHAPEIRAAVCERLSWLGVHLDGEANERHAERISSASSRVDVRVIPTDEEITIARHTLETLRATPSQSHAREAR